MKILEGRLDADVIAEARDAWRRRETLAWIHPRWVDAERARFARDVAGYTGKGRVLLATSGTGGQPKIAVLRWEALEASAAAVNRMLDARATDQWQLALTPAHAGGLAVLVRSWLSGARVSTDVLSVGMTHVSFVPPQLERLLATDTAPPEPLRAVLLGGMAVEPGLLERAQQLGWPVHTTYGLTEAGASVAIDGVPTGASRVTISPDGEVLLEGEALFDGYLGAPKRDTPFHTADRGYFDAQGRLQITGRLDGRLKSGGENVDPREVEAVLRRCPGVTFARVYGVTDPGWGHRIEAEIEGPACEAEVQQFLSARLARWKRPSALRRSERPSR